MGTKTLGAIELEPKRKFYDYEAKYNSKRKNKTYNSSKSLEKRFTKNHIYYS